MTPERERLVAAEKDAVAAFWEYSRSLPASRTANKTEMRRLAHLDKVATEKEAALDAYDRQQGGEG